MRAHATLTIDGEQALGWLTDQPPETDGAVALVLDANPSRQFRPGNLSRDHLVVLHGPRESVRDVFRAAGEAGFTVVWPADEPCPGPSRN